jgi:hypothetical protein
MEYKLVTYKNLIIGQEIKGTKEGDCCRYFSAIIKSINPAYITVKMWGNNGKEAKINTSLMFMVKMSKKEFEDKYHDKAKEVLAGIQNKLHGDELGCHEMWNAWLYGTPYEIAEYCIENNMKVVGHSSDITPKLAMFSGETLDVGVCAEYENGERIWCHYRLEDIEKMIEEYKDLLM